MNAAFGELRYNSIHSVIRTPRNALSDEFIKDQNVATFGIDDESSYLSYATNDGITLSENDLENQFVVFQFNTDASGPSILDMSEVKPSKSGADDKPDALARVQLSSFNVGSDESIDKDTKATIRLDFGKDSNSESQLDTVFWSIAAGFNLYNQAKNKKSDAKDLKSDFNEAFSQRPIEIPGGLGQLSFEVIKHEEPAWWHKIFSFFQSGTGQALTSALGFPAITQQALGFLDELLSKLDKSNPEILFKSRPMTLALTKRAQDAFNAGVPSVNVGVLNPGFCLLARGRDYKSLIDNQPVYMGAYGLLKPKEMSIEEFLKSPGNNPFNKITYAVLKVGTAESKLNPTIDY